jgi:hypothetical protein
MKLNRPQRAQKIKDCLLQGGAKGQTHNVHCLITQAFEQQSNSFFKKMTEPNAYTYKAKERVLQVKEKDGRSVHSNTFEDKERILRDQFMLG